jgi:hypothetical protein
MSVRLPDSHFKKGPPPFLNPLGCSRVDGVGGVFLRFSIAFARKRWNSLAEILLVKLSRQRRNGR